MNRLAPCGPGGGTRRGPAVVGRAGGADRGDGPVGLLMAASVFVLGSMMLVHAALGHYAKRVMSGAAQEGAVAAANLHGGVDEGMAMTDRLIARSGRSMIADWRTTAEVQRSPGGRSIVVVTVVADVIGPLGRWSAEASGVAPLEEFTPQPFGDRIPPFPGP